MPTYNYKSRELIAKIVYYGPGRCGKTTNLQQIHAKMRPETRSELLSVATETDRTIYFDLLPLNLGTISGMKFMVRLFTVPGQVYYSETRKLVLKGADGVVFVADSQDHMLDENRQSLRDLKENLSANGLDYSQIPMVMQWNKRDLPHLVPEAELSATLNERGLKSVPAVASTGEGILETLRHITLGVFNHIKAGGKRPPGSSRPSPAATSSQSSVPASLAPAPAPEAARSSSSSHRAENRSVAPGRWSSALPKANLPTENGRASKSQAPAPAYEAPGPVKLTPDIIFDEFRNLAMMHSQMAERLSELENEVKRLGEEQQHIHELLTRGN